MDKMSNIHNPSNMHYNIPQCSPIPMIKSSHNDDAPLDLSSSKQIPCNQAAVPVKVQDGEAPLDLSKKIPFSVSPYIGNPIHSPHNYKIGYQHRHDISNAMRSPSPRFITPAAHQGSPSALEINSANRHTKQIHHGISNYGYNSSSPKTLHNSSEVTKSSLFKLPTASYSNLSMSPSAAVHKSPTMPPLIKSNYIAAQQKYLNNVNSESQHRNLDFYSNNIDKNDSRSQLNASPFMPQRPLSTGGSSSRGVHYDSTIPSCHMKDNPNKQFTHDEMQKMIAQQKVFMKEAQKSKYKALSPRDDLSRNHNPLLMSSKISPNSVCPSNMFNKSIHASYTNESNHLKVAHTSQNKYHSTSPYPHIQSPSSQYQRKEAYHNGVPVKSNDPYQNSLNSRNTSEPVPVCCNSMKETISSSHMNSISDMNSHHKHLHKSNYLFKANDVNSKNQHFNSMPTYASVYGNINKMVTDYNASSFKEYHMRPDLYSKSAVPPDSHTETGTENYSSKLYESWTKYKPQSSKSNHVVTDPSHFLAQAHCSGKNHNEMPPLLHKNQLSNSITEKGNPANNSMTNISNFDSRNVGSHYSKNSFNSPTCNSSTSSLLSKPLDCKNLISNKSMDRNYDNPIYRAANDFVSNYQASSNHLHKSSFNDKNTTSVSQQLNNSPFRSYENEQYRQSFLGNQETQKLNDHSLIDISHNKHHKQTLPIQCNNSSEYLNYSNSLNSSESLKIYESKSSHSNHTYNSSNECKSSHESPLALVSSKTSITYQHDTITTSSYSATTAVSYTSVQTKCSSGMPVESLPDGLRLFRNPDEPIRPPLQTDTIHGQLKMIPVANVNPMVHRTNNKIIHPKKNIIHRIDEENDKEPSGNSSSEKDESFDSYASVSDNTSPSIIGKLESNLNSIDKKINLQKKEKKRKKSVTALGEVDSNKEISNVKVKKKKAKLSSPESTEKEGSAEKSLKSDSNAKVSSEEVPRVKRKYVRRKPLKEKVNNKDKKNHSIQKTTVEDAQTLLHFKNVLPNVCEDENKFCVSITKCCLDDLKDIIIKNEILDKKKERALKKSLKALKNKNIAESGEKPLKKITLKKPKKNLTSDIEKIKPKKVPKIHYKTKKLANIEDAHQLNVKKDSFEEIPKPKKVYHKCASKKLKEPKLKRPKRACVTQGQVLPLKKKVKKLLKEIPKRKALEFDGSSRKYNKNVITRGSRRSNLYNKNAAYERELRRDEYRKLIARYRRKSLISENSIDEPLNSGEEEQLLTPLRKIRGAKKLSSDESSASSAEEDSTPSVPVKPRRRLKFAHNQSNLRLKNTHEDDEDDEEDANENDNNAEEDENDPFDDDDDIDDENDVDYKNKTKIHLRQRKSNIRKCKKTTPELSTDSSTTPSKIKMRKRRMRRKNIFDCDKIPYRKPIRQKQLLGQIQISSHVPVHIPDEAELEILSEIRKMVINTSIGETVLHRAARLGNMKIVMYCLDTKFHVVNVKDNAGYTPLHESCVRGQMDIARVLIKYGADVNAGALDGTRPLLDAVDHNNVEIARLLLSCGADYRIPTSSGRTCIRVAKTDSMKSFLKGYIHDLNGSSLAEYEVPWKFEEYKIERGLSEKDDDESDENEIELQSEDDHGFSLFADVPDDEELEFIFDTSAELHLPTYRLHLPTSNGSRSYHLLNDVLKKLGVNNHYFVNVYKHINVENIPTSTFYDQIKKSFFCDEKLLSNTSPSLQIVEITEKLKAILGIEVVNINNLGVFDSEELKKVENVMCSFENCACSTGVTVQDYDNAVIKLFDEDLSVDCYDYDHSHDDNELNTEVELLNSNDTYVNRNDDYEEFCINVTPEPEEIHADTIECSCKCNDDQICNSECNKCSSFQTIKS